MLLLLFVSADKNGLQSQVAGGQSADDTGIRLAEFFHDRSDSNALQAQSAVFLRDFQTVVAQFSDLCIDLCGPFAGNVILLALFLDLFVTELPDAVQQVLIFRINQISHNSNTFLYL